MNWFKKKIVAEDPQNCADSAKVIDIEIGSCWSVTWKPGHPYGYGFQTSETKRFFKTKSDAKVFADHIARCYRDILDKGRESPSIQEEK